MADPHFTVSTRRLAPDAGAASSDHSSADLGTLDTAAFASLLEKFAALDPVQNSDAAPELVVSARRGRFTLRTERGRIFAHETNDASRHYTELSPADVPAFLETGSIPTPPPSTEPSGPLPPPPYSKPRRVGLAVILMAIAVAAVLISARVSLAPQRIDFDVPYTVITDQGRIVALRAQSTGSYACTAPGRQRRLEISGDGAVRFTDQNPDRTEPEDITVPSEIVLNASGIPVLRTELGPVEFRAPDTLAFAGETYERRR